MAGGGTVSRVVLVAPPSPAGTRLAERLESRGLAVIRATDATSGASQAGDGQVDCVVSTADLPDGDGVRFLTRMRASNPDVPVVLLLDPDDPEPLNRAQAADIEVVLALDPDRIDLVADRIEAVVFDSRLDAATSADRGLASAIVEAAGRAADATSWEAIEAGIPPALVEAPGVTVAWTSRFDDATRTFEPRAAAGIDVDALEDEPLSDRGGDGGPGTTVDVAEADAGIVATVVLREGESVLGGIHLAMDRESLSEPARRRLRTLGGLVVRLLVALEEGPPVDFTRGAAAGEAAGSEGEALASGAGQEAIAGGPPALDVYSDVIAHELRNNLDVAESYLRLGRDTGEEEHYERVEAAFDRIEGLIEQATAVARREVDPAEVEPVDVGVAAETVWAEFGPDEADLILESPGRVRAQPALLELLLENLFRNSIEHAGPAVTVYVGGTVDGFFVEDDGPGIPPEEREAVFEWGHTTATRDGGVGLALVDRIASAHGWTVRIVDGRTGGARFEVTDTER